MSVNKVILVGNLGQDPELRYTSSGTAVCNLSVATTDYWTDKSGQRQERTEWHRVVVWDKQAEHCNQYLSKGRQVYVEGQLQTRSWEDANNNKRYTTEINAKTVRFLGGGARAQTQTQTQTQMESGDSFQRNNGPGESAGMPENKDYKVSMDANFTADDIPF